MKRLGPSFSPLFLVPSGVIVSTAAAYLLVLSLEFWLVRTLGPEVVAREFNFPVLFQIVLIAGMAAAALLRFWRYHPVFNAPYASWLMASPWNYRRPLPLDPLHLAWQDVLLLAAAFVLERFHLHLAGPLPLIAFLAAYLLSAAAAQFFTKPQPLVLLVLAGLPVPLLLLDVPHAQWWILGILACLYPAAAYATHASLRYFPWRLNCPKPQIGDAEWLFTRLGPVDSQKKLPRLSAVIISVLAAWWVFCATVPVSFPLDEFTRNRLRMLFLLAGVFVALIRLLVYGGFYLPPISIMGRFATGRLIIPGYDIIFIAPLLTALGCIFIPELFVLGVNPPLVCALFTFFTLLPGLAVGPSLYRWKLTGEHRITDRAAAARSARTTHAKSSPEIQLRFS